MTYRSLLLSTTLAGFAMAPAAQAEAPRVVTDIPVVQSLVAQVMGDLGTPELLLDRGADPHNFQLRPTQAQALARADLLFWVGPELTPWLARAIAGVGLRGGSVELLAAEGVTLRDFAHGHSHDHDDHGHDHHDHAHDHDDHGHDHHDHAHDHHDHAHDHDDHGHDHHDHAHDHDDHGHAHDHSHDGTDPHAWLYPGNAKVWLGAIAEALAERDAENAAAYRANAAAAIEAVVALEAEVRELLAPVGEAPLVVFHDAYGYFAHAFGVNVVGTVTLGDAAAPGAARLAELRGMLTAGNVVCIFPEVNHSSRHVDMLVEGTGTRVGPLLDPAGVAMEPGPALYGELMRGLAAGMAACVAEG